MNVKLGNTPAWSDLIHATLWKNDGIFHSFCNFSKSNAFGKNFIRTKLILHKIFFRMSILSSRKTSCIFFNLHSKTTCLDFQVTIITRVGFSQFFLKRLLFQKIGLIINIGYLIPDTKVSFPKKMVKCVAATVFCTLLRKYCCSGKIWVTLKYLLCNL